jgi:DNA topoisomerase-1
MFEIKENINNNKKKKYLVFVESPGKISTIKKYLNDNPNEEYEVIASMGHITQLPSKPGSVFLEGKELKFIWENKEDSVKKLEKILQNQLYDCYYIATDQDREGEGIAFHIYNLLIKNGIEKNIQRIIFNEITKKALKDSLKNPRDLDYNLIHGFLSRLAIDYLIGYTLSPLTWKLGKYSVGRVQSPGVKLIVEQEKIILNFIPQTDYSLDGIFKELNVKPKLSHFDFKKAKDILLTDEENAIIESEDFSIKKTPSDSLIDKVKEFLLNKKLIKYKVTNITEKEYHKSPLAPFTTVTMQQDANTKLNFSAQSTMRNAQKLYEEGLITYMRTDSTNLSEEAIVNIREYIKNSYGDDYLSSEVLQYKSKIKNAQEAHEAIRPTNINNKGEGIQDTYVKSLYELIWKRTVACQMNNSTYKKKDITLENEFSEMSLSGSQLIFLGYLKVYDKEEDEDNILPTLNLKDELELIDIDKTSYTTKHSPRYSEGSLVKQLAKKGIGRPSTYVGIIEILKNRQYVYMDGKSFIGTVKGKILIEYLEKFFPKYIDYNFTANMEEDLDLIANGEKEWQKFLYNFYEELQKDYEKVKNINLFEILDELKNPILKWYKNIVCDKCSSPYNLYIKNSLFFSCSNKACGNTLGLKESFAYKPKSEEEFKEGSDGDGNEKKVYKKFTPYKKKFVKKS